LVKGVCCEDQMTFRVRSKYVQSKKQRRYNSGDARIFMVVQKRELLRKRDIVRRLRDAERLSATALLSDVGVLEDETLVELVLEPVHL